MRLSRAVRVDHSTTQGNTGGVQIDNSEWVRADHNRARGNSVGIVSLTWATLGVAANSHNRIDHNRVGSNNRASGCSSNAPVCRIASGTGVVLLGADRQRVEANRVRGNLSSGIGLAGYCTGLRLSAARCRKLAIDPKPDGNLVTSNAVVGNGATSPPGVSLPGADLDWDLSGQGNCWTKNVIGRSHPATLPDCSTQHGTPGPDDDAAIEFGFTVANQDQSMFTDPLFQELGVEDARIVVPWTVAFSPVEAVSLDEWLEDARRAGVEPLVHFGSATGSRCPLEPCYLPSVAEYAAAFEAFRQRWPSVDAIGVWNEANHDSQPTEGNPARAARYYEVIRDRCAGCRVVAADVLDSPNMESWVSSFQRFSGPVEIWGLHNYGDVNARPGRPLTDGTARLLSITRGDVWLTETAGIVKFVAPGGQTLFPFDESRADEATHRAFELAATYRSRVRRMYLHNWLASPHQSRWDSGIVRTDGSPRPAYWTVRHALAAPPFIGR